MLEFFLFHCRSKKRKKQALREPWPFLCPLRPLFFFFSASSPSSHIHIKMALGALARAAAARLLASQQLAPSSSMTTTAAAALAASSRRAFSACAAAASDEPLIEHEVRRWSPTGYVIPSLAQGIAREREKASEKFATARRARKPSTLFFFFFASFSLPTCSPSSAFRPTCASARSLMRSCPRSKHNEKRQSLQGERKENRLRFLGFPFR